jgi:hypothetical protein
MWMRSSVRISAEWGPTIGITAPMNTFANIPEYPTATMKVVVHGFGHK